MKILIVDLYGDGDALRCIEDTPENRREVEQWNEAYLKGDEVLFSEMLKSKGIAEIESDVLRLI